MLYQINHTMPAKAPAHPWEKTTSPWVRLHIDFAGPFLDKMFFYNLIRFRNGLLLFQ